jgi:hypothetical protein
MSTKEHATYPHTRLSPARDWQQWVPLVSSTAHCQGLERPQSCTHTCSRSSHNAKAGCIL